MNSPMESETSLQEQVTVSGSWMLLTRMLIRGIGLVQTVIVARLLSPEAFGIFGLTLLFMSMLEHFTETGFSEAIIQRTDEVTPYLDSAWTAQILRGGLIALALSLVAGWSAWWFNEPLLETFLPTAGLIVLVGSFRNIGIVYFRKELDFYREFLFRTTGPLLAFPLVVLTAYYTRSVWALMVMLFVEKTTETALSYSLHDYRPSLRFNLKKLGKLFGFGRWIFSSKILQFSLVEGDDFFVAKYLGSFQLGLYQVAFRFSQLPVKEFCRSVNQVLFPAFSKLQDDIEELRRTWLDSLRIVSFLAFPMALGIFLVAPEAVRVILGKDWTGMIGPVRVLAFLGLLRSINYDAIFKATGNPAWTTYIALVRLGIIVLTILPLSAYFGVTGAALSVLVAAAAVEPLALHRALTILETSLGEFLQSFLLNSASSAIMVGVILMIQFYVPVESWVGLLGEIVAGSTTYFLTVTGLAFSLETRTKYLLVRIWSTLRKRLT